MFDEYIWLLKGDGAYKNYINKGWKTIISVKVESRDIYYCLASNKQFISEEEKISLLAPICIINKDYKDCLILINDENKLCFLWKDKRCFTVSESMFGYFSESSLPYFDGNLIQVSSAAQLVSENSILVKSSSIVPVILLVISFIIIITIGLYVWLL